MLRKIVFNFSSTLLLTLLLFNTVFAQEKKKIAYGILIDNTGSLRSQFSEVLTISQGIVERIHQRGSISLFNFRTQGNERNGVALVTSGTEWSQDKALLERYIGELFIVPGQTVLIDAINSVAGQVKAKAQFDHDVFGEKIIFLITDGEDRASKIKEKELIKALQESSIKVYAIGLVEELDKDSRFTRQGAKDKAVNFLNKIAKETGGRAIFPNSKKADLTSLLNELVGQ